MTSAISGPSFSGSSLSAALARSLASRLHQRLGSAGSMEYSQTWKSRVTPAGRSLWAHTASARRISDNDFTGWPTASVFLAAGDPQKIQKRRAERMEKYGNNGFGMNLEQAAQALAGYPTATRNDFKGAPYQVANGKKYDTLPGAAAKFSGWPTTTTRDSKTDGLDAPGRTGGESLPQMALGQTTELFRVPTGRRAVLAPEFSLWLMGFPEAWAMAAPGAKDWQEAQAALVLECSRALETQSSQSLPPSSSEPQ